MPSVADAPLGELCREAAPETVVAFLADVYEARGWSVDRDGGRRLSLSAGDRTRTVAVVHPADSMPPADLAATAGTLVVVGDGTAVAPDTEVLGTDALRRQLAYAVERPVARRLLETHFGWQPDPADTSPGAATDDGEGTDSEDEWTATPPRSHSDIRGTAGPLDRLTGRTSVFLAALLVIGLAGGAAVALSESGGSTAATGETTGGGTVEPVAVTATTPGDVSSSAAVRTGDSATATPATATPAATGTDRGTYTGLPSGIDPSEGIDARRLSEAHRSVLENTSYRLTLTHREFVDGRLSAIHSETIRVENETRYSAHVTHTGSFLNKPRTIAVGDVYADGSTRYERTSDAGVERGVLLSYDRFLVDYVYHLYRQLKVRETSIVAQTTEGNTTTTYVVTGGNVDPRIENVSGSIRVTDDGLIERARWSYDISGTPSGNANVSVVFGMRVTDIGSTTVAEPGWVNATG